MKENEAIRHARLAINHIESLHKLYTKNKTSGWGMLHNYKLYELQEYLEGLIMLEKDNESISG
jgi:hypothetical protein